MIWENGTTSLRADVAQALRVVEPVCAGLCAERPDRGTDVLPRLWATHAAAVATVDDVRAYTRNARRFHEELVAACGNEAFVLVLGTIEAICTAETAMWIEAGADDGQQGAIADREYRLAGLHDHAEILAHIELGDRAGAERAARRHAEGRVPVA